MLVGAAIGSNPITALLVAVVLFALGRVVINRMAVAEAYPWLVKVMTISLVLHLLAAPAQILVTQHFYHGISDWTRYTHQGALLAPDFRHFNFTLSGANVRQIVNDGSVSIATGIVMALVGANNLATFLVFSWFSWIGAILFFRAFSLTFRGADPHRYALLVFFFPSLIFWTADASKEAIMTIALAMVAYGTAKILVRQKGGFVLLIPGAVLAFYIRPNELVLVLTAFVVALLVPTANVRQNYGGVRRVISVIFCAILLTVSFNLTQHYLVRNGSISGQLATTSKNNSLAGSGGIPYSTSPATYPRDVYEVLFNPLPVNFHGFGELVAAGENTLLLGLLFLSLRQLRIIPRAAFARPYVMMCLIYTAGFMYAFAALGNLGLIERERSMLLPFLLVLFGIPRSPKHTRHPYDWELRRRARLERRQAIEAARIRRPTRRTRPTPTGP